LGNNWACWHYCLAGRTIKQYTANMEPCGTRRGSTVCPADCCALPSLLPLLPSVLAQRRIQEHHYRKPEHQTYGGGCLMAVAVGLGNDLMGYHEDHRPGGQPHADRVGDGKGAGHAD